MKKKIHKILIIDNDMGMVKLLQKWLEVANYEVVSATNAEYGLDMVMKETPDLILLDVVLPDIKGWDVARTLKKTPQAQDIPVVFITGTIEKDVDKQNQPVEVDGVEYHAFGKPIHQPKFLSTIKKLIRRREHEKTSS